MSATVVMVPLDGSGRRGAPVGCLPGEAIGRRRAVDRCPRAPAVLLDGETLGTVIPDESVRQKETAYFTGVQTRLKKAEVPVAADLLDGSVVRSLAEYAANLQPAWIVMLSHARGAVARFFLGETATEFVRQSPCPVLLVHEGGDRAPNVQHVLVPLDGSPLAERMTGPATAFAKTVGADVTLLIAQADARHPDADGYLARQATALQNSGLNVETRLVSEAMRRTRSCAAPPRHCCCTCYPRPRRAVETRLGQ